MVRAGDLDHADQVAERGAAARRRRCRRARAAAAPGPRCGRVRLVVVDPEPQPVPAALAHGGDDVAVGFGTGAELDADGAVPGRAGSPRRSPPTMSGRCQRHQAAQRDPIDGGAADQVVDGDRPIWRAASSWQAMSTRPLAISLRATLRSRRAASACDGRRAAAQDVGTEVVLDGRRHVPVGDAALGQPHVRLAPPLGAVARRRAGRTGSRPPATAPRPGSPSRGPLSLAAMAPRASSDEGHPDLEQLDRRIDGPGAAGPCNDQIIGCNVANMCRADVRRAQPGALRPAGRRAR